MTGEDYLWRTRPGEARQLIERWIHHPGLRRLVEFDGGQWPEGDLEVIVEALVEFSAVWDKRQGQSRLMFHDGNESRSDDRAQIIYTAAEQLGLIRSGPPITAKPDYLLILGGLATGVEPRVRYAAELIESSKVEPRAIVGLGSFRVLAEKELPIAETYAPGAQYELDLLAAMMSSTLGIDNWHSTSSGDPVTDPARAEIIMRADADVAMMALASRSSRPDERPANTADTYEQLALIEQLHPGQQMVLITSSIYRPYQHLQAVRLLTQGHAATVETVGVPSIGGQPTHTPTAYLQEVRSGLQACHALLAKGRRPGGRHS
jgi:hypothetical protein